MPDRDDPSAQPDRMLRALVDPHTVTPLLLAAMPAGVTVIDRQGRTLYTNPAFQALFGLQPEESPADDWTAAVHDEDRQRVITGWAEAISGGLEWSSEFRCRHRDGSIRWIAARIAPARGQDGRLVALVGAFEDVTLRTRLRSKLSVLIEASGILLESPRLTAVLPATMTLAKDLIAADGYAVWRLQTGGEWRIVASTGISANFAESIIRSYQGQSVATVPFSGPLSVDDVSALPMLAERQALYASEGIRSILVVPLKISGALSGTLVFYYRTSQRFDDIRVRMAAALGNLAAAAISTAEMYEEQLSQREKVERAHQHSAFLAEASVALGSSLDYEATLKTVARLAVPRTADWCAVDILDGDGRLKRLAVAHKDPEKVEFARTLRERYPKTRSHRTAFTRSFAPGARL